MSGCPMCGREGEEGAVCLNGVVLVAADDLYAADPITEARRQALEDAENAACDALEQIGRYGWENEAQSVSEAIRALMDKAHGTAAATYKESLQVRSEPAGPVPASVSWRRSTSVRY